MRNIRVFMIVALVAGIGLIGVQQAVSQKAAKSTMNPSGGLLTGTVRSASGAEEGITVSARVEGSPITTTVFTDQDGVYIFPPLEKGKYQVWAQAVGLTTGWAQADVNGSKNLRQDFMLKPAAQSVVTRQMTGADWFATLPEATIQDRRTKDVFAVNCAGCHQPSYPLQNRFDKAGWTKIIDVMKRVNVTGAYNANREPYPIMQYHQQELAEYLGKVRGPDTSSLKINLVSRPKGESTLAVITEYNIPIAEAPGEYAAQDGSNWSEGVPSSMNGVRGSHDVEIDFSGNLWVVNSQPNPNRTYAKIDGKTGEVTSYKVTNSKGRVRTSHGLRKDTNGILWFNLRRAGGQRGGEEDQDSLARVDPMTGKLDIFTPPADMGGVGGSIDVDGKGGIWASTDDGALRFDPKTSTFREFKSVNLTKIGKGLAIGGSTTYGVAGDSQGNGYWALMAMDIVGKGDLTTGKSIEIKMPPRAEKMEIVTPEARKLYEETGNDWNSASTWTQAPRRLSGDHTGNAVWVANTWGETLGKIDTRTNKVTLYPVPKYSGIYATVVDNKHVVWMNMMNNDSIAKFDPATEKWSEYMLPTHGAETRHIAVNDHVYPPEVVVPYSRTNKVARFRFRTKQDLEALKQQVQSEKLQAKN